MEEFVSSRRQSVQQELKLPIIEERESIDKSIKKEEERQAKKERKRQELLHTPSYRMVQGVSKYWDNWYLDPIVGFFLPGVGDFITSAVGVPAIWMSLMEIRSIPLTLAVIYNLLLDMLIGMIPCFIGDILDAFNKANKKNLKLITGFVEDDQTIIKEVNRKAIWTCVFIAILCYLIYLMVKLVIWFGEQIGVLWNYIVGLF